MATRRTAGTRAKDSDRNNTCQVLDSALSDGQLSMEEHRNRVAAATAAATLGDLQSLVDDLQNEDAPVQMPELRRPSPLSTMSARGGLGIRAAMAAVLVIFGIAIGWGLYGNTTSPLSFTSDPGAKSDGIPAKVITPPRQLMSLGGLNGLFEQMRQKFDDTRGFDLTIFDDYASLERQDPAEPRRVLRYSYRGGWADPSETTVSSDERVVDLGAVDVPTLVGLIRGAPATLGMNPNEVKDMHVSISHDDDVDAAPDALSVQIFVSPNFGNSGYFEVTGAGNMKALHKPSP